MKFSDKQRNIYIEAQNPSDVLLGEMAQGIREKWEKELS